MRKEKRKKRRADRMTIRKTTTQDISAAAEIYDMARHFMRQTGNLNQWNMGYPNADDVKQDVIDGTGYVCEEDGEIVAVFFFKKGEDPTYKIIVDGSWKDETPYAVIHRVAVKYNGRGIADKIYAHCFALHPHLRIDTHKDNIPMQRSLQKNGFTYQGIIFLENGEERMAFEKL